jgi:hypothetical protein
MLTVLLGLGLMMWGGCYYDNVIFPDGGEVTGDVSFTADIIPIFDKDCNSSGCHNPGGQKPDLSSANAFTALANGNYINTSAPEDSELYLWMKGLKALPMPPSGSDAGNTAKVIAWIRQGALNN